MVKARVVIQNRDGGRFTFAWVFTSIRDIERDYGHGFVYDFDNENDAKIFLDCCVAVSIYRSGIQINTYAMRQSLERARELYPELFLDECCSDVIYKSSRSWG
jgi:hypothetical protein